MPSGVRRERGGLDCAGVIGVTNNPQGPNYCGNLSEDEVVRRLATAEGGLGTAAEYLFRTRDGLRLLDMADPVVERLAQLVEAVRVVPGEDLIDRAYAFLCRRLSAPASL